MINWKLKAALFHAFNILPMGAKFHYLAQRYITKTLPREDSQIDALVEVAREYVNDYKTLGITPLEHATFLEIGAGRDLVVPLALRLLGVKHVTSVDIERLANIELVNSAAKKVCYSLGLPPVEFATWDDLANFGIMYLAPFDLVESSENISTVDAFVSNEVLEHIPVLMLAPLFKSVISKLKDGGVSIHSIDYSDHYARDGGVSRYNFLQYSDSDWEKYNPSMHYVNRLRHSEYILIMKDCGLEIISCDKHAEIIPKSSVISPRFSNYSSEDLNIMRSRIVGQSLKVKISVQAQV